MATYNPVLDDSFRNKLAIGIATGIILEFEFGTNWSNIHGLLVIFLVLPLQ